jgi:hypothetical protein
MPETTQTSPGDGAEPRATAQLTAFEEGDFHALSESLARDAQYNDRRLVLRRKLLGLAKVFAAEAKQGGLALDVRTSLHHPHSFNGMVVRRMWASAFRAKGEKARLKRTLGAELAKDLDSAHRNAHLCLALESGVLEVSFRIHKEAWYDGQNLVKRIAEEGQGGWLEILNGLDGYQLKLADWKGEWRCGSLTRERLEEFLKYYTPGEHALTVERRWPALRGPARDALLGETVPEQLVTELGRLVPLYRYAAWSKESSFLFGG